MARLFVDVDGTLVKWGKGDNLINQHEKPWEFNHHVIDYVGEWRAANPTGVIVVWSGGGVKYAATWARRAFDYDRFYPIAWAAKGLIMPAADDLFIDDSPAKVWAPQSISPDSLIDAPWFTHHG